MCEPSVLETLTREERLMERAKVREHHAALYRAYEREYGAGPATRAWRDHLELHREAARRLKEARPERDK